MSENTNISTPDQMDESTATTNNDQTAKDLPAANPAGQMQTTTNQDPSPIKGEGQGQASGSILAAQQPQGGSPVPATQGSFQTLIPQWINRSTREKASSIMINGYPLITVVDHMILYFIQNKNCPHPISDIGAGNLMADTYIGKLRYVPERKKWYCFDGQKWVPDSGAAMEYCKELARILSDLIYAVDPQKVNDGKRKILHYYVERWQTRRGRETILKDASTVYPVRMSQFDQDPFLLNCLNGTLNMHDRSSHPHDPSDLLTKVANVIYDSNARCDRWEKHVNEIMLGDADKVRFLQQALGYGLSGDTRHECFFILYGPTSRNGKGVTMETFATLMGDYARSARPETITQKQIANGSGPSEDLARLAGARFINISEPDKKMVLSSSLVKTLTGNDTISARYLHENSFEFRLQGKLYINTNYLPRVTDATVFRSDRVKVIPFERHFEPNEQDKNLKHFLSQPENLSGILNWCLTGLCSLNNDGFVDCEAVRLAVEDYEETSDKFGLFVEERLEKSPNSEMLTETVYDMYKQWCDTNRYQCGSISSFRNEMASRAQIVKKRPASDPKANPRSIVIGYKPRGITRNSPQLPTT